MLRHVIVILQCKSYKIECWADVKESWLLLTRLQEGRFRLAQIQYVNITVV